MCLTNNERQKLIDYIKPRLSENRFRHTLGTEKMAVLLAQKCGENIAAAQTAALLHDSAKCLHNEEKQRLIKKYEIYTDDTGRFNTDLLHGHIAAHAVKEDLGICDENILNAIAYHTTGRPGMSRLEKIIYSSDVVEENRVYDVVEYLREAVYADIDTGTYIIMNHVLRYLLENDMPVYGLTVEAYNSLLSEYKNTEVQGG